MNDARLLLFCKMHRDHHHSRINTPSAFTRKDVDIRESYLAGLHRTLLR